MPRPFLSARWRHLAIVTYAVDPARLAPFLPRGGAFTLDTRDDLALRGGPAGRAALLSLVAFEFLDTRAFGVRWPTMVNFPEINLRFYVRRGEQRGVMFLREIVPRTAIAFVARHVYGEPYVTAPIDATITHDHQSVRAEYTLTWPDGESPGLHRRHVLRVEADGSPSIPPPDSLDHWIKEHQWGFTADPRGGAWAYEVRHPVWRVYPNPAAEVAFGFGVVYGPAWADLDSARPVSVVLAEGSDVSVFPRRRAD